MLVWFPLRLCDSTLTIMVSPGALMVTDKHSWSWERIITRLVLALVAHFSSGRPLLVQWSPKLVISSSMVAHIAVVVAYFTSWSL